GRRGRRLAPGPAHREEGRAQEEARSEEDGQEENGPGPVTGDGRVKATPHVFSQKDLLDLSAISREDIELVLETAESMREINARSIKKVPTLRGKLVVNLFYEASTRTRFSFEIAERRLSADSIAFSQAGTSVSKGETLLDTAKNLMAMAPDCIVIRHQRSG